MDSGKVGLTLDPGLWRSPDHNSRRPDTPSCCATGSRLPGDPVNINSARE